MCIHTIHFSVLYKPTRPCIEKGGCDGHCGYRESRLREHSGEEGKKEENPGELDVKTPPFSFFLSPSFQARLHSTPPLFFFPPPPISLPRATTEGPWNMGIAEEVTLLLYQIDQGRKRKGILPLRNQEKGGRGLRYG